MRSSPKKRRIFLLLTAACMVMVAVTSEVAASVERDSKGCNLSMADYAARGYKVRDLRIKDPFAFLRLFSRKKKSLGLPLKPGDVFSTELLSKSRKVIQNKLASDGGDDGPLQINIVSTSLENCSNQTGTEPLLLDVVFRVLTTNYNAYLSHSWEFAKRNVEETATAVTTHDSTDEGKLRLSITPAVHYDRTRHVFGGVLMRVQRRSGPIGDFKVSANGSRSANAEEFELGGTKYLNKALVNSLEYRVLYQHSNLPASNNRLERSSFQLHLTAASKPLGRHRWIFRYGTELNLGNQHSELQDEAAAENSVADSQANLFKTFSGATFTARGLSFSGSFAVGAGATTRFERLEFAKYIGDVAISKRWIPKNQEPGDVHKITTLEFRAAAGLIHNFGSIPVSERFFGGNSFQNFASNSNWEISDGPLIRSIPANRLNAQATIGAIGGTKFYSMNFTLSQPVWGRPLLFKEIARETDFEPALNSATNSARSILKNHYATKLNLFEPVVDAMLTDGDPSSPTLKAMLQRLGSIIDGLPEDLPISTAPEVPDEESETACEYCDLRESIGDSITLLLSGAFQSKEEASERLLAVLTDGDIDACRINIEECSTITALRLSASRFADAIARYSGMIADPVLKETLRRASTQIITQTSRVETEQVRLVNLLDRIDLSRAADLADRDMKDVEPVITTITDELNIFAISPVAMFDAARLFPDRFGTRFGAGGGIRFTVANVNLTIGYAFALNPKPGEGRGAFTFSFKIDDLFR